MTLFDNIKKFFGFTEQPHNHQYSDGRRYEPSSFWNDEREDNYDRSHPPPNEEHMGFRVFSDPFEIHRYFEQQMNDMLQMFGFHEHSPSFFGGTTFDLPALEEHQGHHGEMPYAPSDNLRDQYLKPGYEKQTLGESVPRTDSDVDGKLDMGDLGSVFKGRPRVRTQFFGQSVTSRTVQRPDGTVETHRTIRNNDGSEETTVTKKRGDQEYTVIKKRDCEGKEEVVENFVNIDEKDAGRLMRDEEPTREPLVPMSPHNWFNFDKYFK